MPDRVKKHSMAVNPRKDKSSDTLAMRRDFAWAFSAPPASSPRMPNSSVSSRAGRRRLPRAAGAGSGPSRKACSGVMRLRRRAGSQAENSTVSPAASSAPAATSGCSWKTAGSRPATSAAAAFTAASTARQAARPSAVPAASGASDRAAASCSRQARIWRGVAPMLARMPNWCSRACMVISKELRISSTSAAAAAPSTASKKGSSSGGLGSCGSVTR